MVDIKGSLGTLLKQAFASSGTLVGYIILLVTLKEFDVIPKLSEIGESLSNILLIISLIAGFGVAMLYFAVSAFLTLKKFFVLKNIEIKWSAEHYSGEEIKLDSIKDPNLTGAVSSVAKEVILGALGNPGIEKEPKPTKEEKKALKEEAKKEAEYEKAKAEAEAAIAKLKEFEKKSEE